MTISNCVLRKTNIFQTLLILVLFIPLSGCIFGPAPECSCAPVVPEQLEQSRLVHKQLTDKTSLILSSFAVVPPLVAILENPSPQSTDIDPYLGVYTEDLLEPTGFGWVPSTNPDDGISVHFLNGISVAISNIQYDLDAKLTSYEMVVSSQAITALTENVRMNLMVQRTNVLDALLPGVQSSGTRMLGTIVFHWNGAFTLFELDWARGRYIGQLPLVDPLFNISGSGTAESISFKTNSFYGVEFWKTDRILGYTLSDTPGVWIAQLMTDRYQDINVQHDVSLVLQGGAPINGNELQYTPVELPPALHNGVWFLNSRYARVAGGPYVCDMLSRTPLGSPLFMTYDFYFPAVQLTEDSMFSCAIAVTADPFVVP